jgi:GNAT superfamily N-acetyltransferase
LLVPLLPLPPPKHRAREEQEERRRGGRAEKEKEEKRRLTQTVMNILAVSPSYQRQGLGAALLAPVLEQADREGRKTYIEASAKGVGLYRKFGWRECDEPIRVDLGRFEGFEDVGVVKNVLMMREPGAGLG